MSNEEQAALDFFSQPENLPLALVAAEHLDGIRLRLNNEFWIGLRSRIDSMLEQHALNWDSSLTEDRNNDSCLVGLYAQPQTGQGLFLRPFMEQQFSGDAYRIFYGLMWSTSPTLAQTSLPPLDTLRETLQASGFKENASFLAWQWLPWRPRQKDFLTRFATRREEFLGEAEEIWNHLFLNNQKELDAVNLALKSSAAAGGTGITLEQMRNKLKSG